MSVVIAGFRVSQTLNVASCFLVVVTKIVFVFARNNKSICVLRALFRLGSHIKFVRVGLRLAAVIGGQFDSKLPAKFIAEHHLGIRTARNQLWVRLETVRDESTEGTI